MRAVVGRSGIWILVFLMLVALIQLALGDNNVALNKRLESVAAIATSGNMALARNQLRELVVDYPNNIDVLQLQASLMMGDSNLLPQAIEIFERIITTAKTTPATYIFTNYIEALRLTQQYEKAHQVGDYIMKNYRIERYEDGLESLFLNLALVESSLGNSDLAHLYHRKAIEIDPKRANSWRLYMEYMVNNDFMEEAERVGAESVKILPNEPALHYFYGIAMHHLKKVDEALYQYQVAEAIDPNYLPAQANIAAAYQGLGRAAEAIAYYERIIPLLPNDAGVMNNLGALLGTMHRKEEEVYWLTRALEINPYLEEALVNLAGFYQDEGLLDDARIYLERVKPLVREPELIDLRLALMMSPLSISFEQMAVERNAMKTNAMNYLQGVKKFPARKVPLDTTMDRIHFYIPYHGLNDRHIQESIGQLYPHFTNDVSIISPLLEHTTTHKMLKTEKGSRSEISALFSSKKRIGFMSKFFGIFEPHGMLLDGIMKYLPRNQFTVVCMAIARTDGKPIAPVIYESCDEVHEISLIFQHARDRIMRLNLDVLLFADLVSEPMNHFLAFSRMAPIQMAFWGNPITSGSSMIDYYLSAEIMEHPYRNRMSSSDDPYTEQVLLTDGQGIWYFRPVDPAIELQKVNLTNRVGPVIQYKRSDFNFSNDWFIYMLPQSTFKIHPLYDHVLEDILQQNPKAHLVVTGGRRPLWTELYQQRLTSIFGPEIMDRFHVVERVSSENFYTFLSLADAILHPFPFDGSRTSADALLVQRPFVTMPTEYLRGRMGFAFLRTMNIPELVARDIPEYIQISSRLAQDPLFYQSCVDKIRENVDLIWEDMQIPYDVARFFQRLLDFPVSSYEAFLTSTGRRNVEEDLRRTQIRTENAHLFDVTFGKQKWQLDEHGKVVMEAYLDHDQQQWPRLFEYWRRYQAPNRVWKQHPSFENVTSAKARGFDPAQYMNSFIELKTKQKNTANPSSKIKSSPELEQKATESKPPVTSKPAMQMPSADPKEVVDPIVTKDEDKLQLFKKQLRAKEFDAAFHTAVELFPSKSNDPDFLTEVGAMQYYRGEYSEAFDICLKAVELFRAQDKVLDAVESYACVGVSACYLADKSDDAIQALSTAYNLQVAREQRADYEEMIAARFNASFFTITLESLEANLISSLDASRRYDDCIIVSEQIYELPFRQLYGAYIAVFSIVQWSMENKYLIDELEQRLLSDVVNRVGRTDSTSSLWDQIQHFQVRGTAINYILPCYNKSPSFSKHYQMATKALFDILQTIDRNQIQKQNTGKLVTSFVPPQQGVVLLTQYFDPLDKVSSLENPSADTLQTLKVLQEDMNQVLIKNLMNPFIDQIVMLTEKSINFTSFPNTYKIQQYVLGERLTFRDAFVFSNEYLVNRTVVLANADIYFDSSLSRLFSTIDGSPLLPENMLLSILKWNEDEEYLSLPLRSDSQDIWIFRTPIGGHEGYLGPHAKEDINEDFHMDLFLDLTCNFALGLPRCDNRIAYLFSHSKMAKSLNLKVANVPFHIHGFEVQRTLRIGTLYPTKTAIHGEGVNILISDQLPF